MLRYPFNKASPVQYVADRHFDEIMAMYGHTGWQAHVKDDPGREGARVLGSTKGKLLVGYLQNCLADAA